MDFDVGLIAYSSNQPDFFSWESFSALFKHVGVSNMKAVEDSIGIKSDNFFLCVWAHTRLYSVVKDAINLILNYSWYSEIQKERALFEVKFKF